MVLNPKTGLVSPQFHVVFDDDFTTVPHLRKGTVPPNWAKLVESSSEKSTSEFYDLTKTWFAPISDASADEIFERSNANEGEEPVRNDSEGASSANEGEATGFSEGAGAVPTTQASEGDSDENNLFMPDMINLESAGLRRSNRLASQPRKKYTFKSALNKFCAFGLLIATSLSQPTVVFSHAHV